LSPITIYEIKADSGENDDKAEALAELLLKVFNRDQEQEIQRRYKLSECRAELVAATTLRFLATAEHVSRSLGEEANLDWSPAVIGLCKAVELEVVERLVLPLAAMCASISLESDIKDKDISRIAKFCRDGGGKPPELGTFAYFLQTVISSEKRRSTSALMLAFVSRMKDWPGANWILDSGGLHASLSSLTKQFRNRAAHTDELSKQDYESCRNLVVGEDGLLWRLVQATQAHK